MSYAVRQNGLTQLLKGPLPWTLQRSKAQSGHWIERSEFDPREVDNKVLIPFSDEVHLRVGDFVEVRITEANEHDLRADAI